MYHLVVTEKPSVAQSIAAVIGAHSERTDIWKATDISSAGVSVIW